MSKVRVEFTGDTSNLRRAIRSASNAISRFSRGAGRAVTGLARGFRSLITGGVAKLGLAFGALGAASAAWRGVKLAADMEALTVSFSVLTGSVESAKKTIKELDDLSNSTPLSPEEVMKAGARLAAYGFEADKLVDVVRKLGDVSQGIGSPLGEIAYLYGTSLTQGRLYARDMLQLTNRGVNIRGALAQVVVPELGDEGVKQIDAMVSAGKIGFEELDKAWDLLTGKGGQFEDMLLKQSRSFNGLMSTLTGKFRSKMRDVFAPLMVQLKPILEELSNYLDSSAGKLKQIGSALAEVVGVLIQLFKSGELGSAFVLAMKIGAKELVNIIWSGIKSSVQYMVTALGSLFDLISKKFKDASFWSGLVNVLKGSAQLLGYYVSEAVYKALDSINIPGLVSTPSVYDRGLDLWVARSNVQAGLSDMNGNLDFVKGLKDINSRALDAARGINDEPIMDIKLDLDKMVSILEGAKSRIPKIEVIKDGSSVSEAGVDYSSLAAKFAAPFRGYFAESNVASGGGGRLFASDNRVMSEQQRQTAFQRRTAEATEEIASRDPVSGVVAVYQ